MAFILTILAVFVLLVASDVWWRRQQTHGEFSRKFVHITVGSFVAFWPYFLSTKQIVLLSAAFLVTLIVSRYYNLFQAIHSVQRPTYGEFWFTLVVGLLVVMHNPHIYTAALLEMSLADGLAAVVGLHYGNGHRYSVFGSSKSIVGTATFFVTSCFIIAGYSMATAGAIMPPMIIAISLGATALENFAAKGLDNLLVPLFVAGTLFWLS